LRQSPAMYSPGWPATHHSPTSAFVVPGLQTCTTMLAAQVQSYPVAFLESSAYYQAEDRCVSDSSPTSHPHPHPHPQDSLPCSFSLPATLLWSLCRSPASPSLLDTLLSLLFTSVPTHSHDSTYFASISVSSLWQRLRAGGGRRPPREQLAWSHTFLLSDSSLEDWGARMKGAGQGEIDSKETFP
jgi:hypothetical protein